MKKYFPASDATESSSDTDFEDFQFEDNLSNNDMHIDSEDSLDDDNEILLARLNRKLDLESNHIQDFSNKLHTLKRELKCLKYESNMIGKSIMPDIFIRYFTNDKRIKEKVHQLHYNTWKMEMIKIDRKCSTNNSLCDT